MISFSFSLNLIYKTRQFPATLSQAFARSNMYTDIYLIDKKMKAIREKSPLSNSVLKLFAILSMLVDHTGATIVSHLRYSSSFSPEVQQFMSKAYLPMRKFGRLAFPIFCFFIVEGYFRTHDVKKYAGRLFLFALISEFPFDYALHHGQALMHKQNVYWTLLIGLLVIWCIDHYFRGMIVPSLIVLCFGMAFAWLLKTDYSYHGVFLIEVLYITRFSSFYQNACGAAYVMWYEGIPTPLSFLLTFFYNGKKGWPLKHFFYWFYPAHLMLLGMLTWVVLK